MKGGGIQALWAVMRGLRVRLRTIGGGKPTAEVTDTRDEFA